MAYASKYYDPVKAHEYYMKHRKLKGRKKRKKKTTRKRTRKLTYNSQLKALKESLNEAGLRAAEIEIQKLQNERKELNDKLRKKWNEKIKEIKKRIENATEEEKEALKTELAIMQVDYKTEKKIVKDYFDAKTLEKVTEIASNNDYKK